MKLYLFNFGTNADLECHHDDGGHEDLSDLISVNARVARSIEEAQQVAVRSLIQDLEDDDDDESHIMEALERGDFVWEQNPKDAIVGDQRLIINGELYAILNIRSFTLDS